MNTVSTSTSDHWQESRTAPSKTFKIMFRLSLAAILAVALFSVTLSEGNSYRALLFPDRDGELLTHEVQRTKLKVNLLASGMLESASTVDVLSEVEGQVGIISLLPRGTSVEKGDVVVELDSSQLKTAVMQQRVAVQQAKAATGQAREALQLARSQAASSVKAAQLALKFAELDLNKYIEGDYPQEVRTIDSEIKLAEEERERAKDRIAYSEELKELGYLSKGQLDADKLAQSRIEVALKLANEKKRLLEKFTFARMKQDLDSKLSEARRSVETSLNLAKVTVEQAENQLKVQEATEELQATKLSHLEDQIAKCQLIAPQAGVVLYPMAEDEDDTVVKQGATIRQNQHVFTIPDTEALQVNASIHEAVVHLLDGEKKAKIKVDGLRDRKLKGTTIEVSSLPDLQSWRKSTVNFYPAIIRIDDDVAGLRPGMNAKVDIVVDEVIDVLTIPITAVVRSDDVSQCYVLNNGREPELREIELGKANDEFVVIESGVSEGEDVVVSPYSIRSAK